MKLQSLNALNRPRRFKAKEAPRRRYQAARPSHSRFPSEGYSRIDVEVQQSRLAALRKKIAPVASIATSVATATAAVAATSLSASVIGAGAGVATLFAGAYVLGDKVGGRIFGPVVGTCLGGWVSALATGTAVAATGASALAVAGSALLVGGSALAGKIAYDSLSNSAAPNDFFKKQPPEIQEKSQCRDADRSSYFSFVLKNEDVDAFLEENKAVKSDEPRTWHIAGKNPVTIKKTRSLEWNIGK